MAGSEKSINTIADIARLAGVSKSTVSRALGDSSLISIETRTRIQAIAHDYNFQMNRGAQSLSLRRSNTVGFIIPVDKTETNFVTDPFELEILGAVVGGLAAYNYDMLLAQIDVHDTTWPARYLDSGLVDGLILFTCSKHPKQIETLVKRQAKFIVWGFPLPQFTYPSVNSDDINGSRMAVEHLISQGRKRIAFLGGASYAMEVIRRFEGYNTALKSAGIPIDPALITYGDFSSRSGSEAMARLLKQAPDLDALFVNSDLMAIAAMALLREMGYSIPQQVAVVGYDDISLAAYCDPPLTTIRQNILRTGEILVKNLMQYIQDGVVTHVTMPVELVIRKSSGG